MPTEAEIIAEVEARFTDLIGGTPQDIVADEFIPGNYPTELKYVEADGGFFISWKAGGQDDIYISAESVYNILKENAAKVLSSPAYLVPEEKPVRGQSEKAKVQALIDAAKA